VAAFYRGLINSTFIWIGPNRALILTRNFKTNVALKKEYFIEIIDCVADALDDHATVTCNEKEQWINPFAPPTDFPTVTWQPFSTTCASRPTCTRPHLLSEIIGRIIIALPENSPGSFEREPRVLYVNFSYSLSTRRSLLQFAIPYGLFFERSCWSAALCICT